MQLLGGILFIPRLRPNRLDGTGPKAILVTSLTSNRQRESPSAVESYYRAALVVKAAAQYGEKVARQ